MAQRRIAKKLWIIGSQRLHKAGTIYLLFWAASQNSFCIKTLACSDSLTIHLKSLFKAVRLKLKLKAVGIAHKSDLAES